jgi:hypothetical protein
VKIRLVALFLVAGSSCASPQLGNHDPGGGPLTGLDLSTPAVGGNGGPDLASGGDRDLAMSVSTRDLAMTPSPDLAQSIVDMATPPPDLAQPIVDMAQPPPPDMACARNPAASTCGTYPQCGCASGQNCNVEKPDGTAQCALAGSTGSWSVCDPQQSGVNGDGVCKVGASCVDGVCAPFCNVDSDCVPGQVCGQVNSVDANGNATPIPGFKTCSSYCDPTNPTSSAGGYVGCGASVVCVTSGSSTSKTTYCVGPAGSGTSGQSCVNNATSSTDPTMCAPGYGCILSASGLSASCYKYCHVGKTGECTGTQTCRSQSTKQYAGSVEIGYCR